MCVAVFLVGTKHQITLVTDVAFIARTGAVGLISRWFSLICAILLSGAKLQLTDISVPARITGAVAGCSPPTDAGLIAIGNSMVVAVLCGCALLPLT